MKLQEFLKLNNMKLEIPLKEAIQKGISLMKLSKDPLHNENHVFELFDLLSKFLNHEKAVNKRDIDFGVLICAISWHDVWKAKHEQTKNLFKFKFQQFWDGIGSAKLFRKYANKTQLDETCIEKIIFSIKHHGGFYERFLDHEDILEAKILYDLDNLAFWSMTRFATAKKKYLKENGKLKNPKFIPLAKWVIKKLAGKKQRYFYSWSEIQFRLKKQKFIKLLKKYVDLNIKDKNFRYE